MPSRFLISGMHFFAITAAVAVAVALLAPIDAIRFLGVVALACAGVGFLVQFYALQRVDPDAVMVLRKRVRAPFDRLRAVGTRAADVVADTAHSASSRTIR